MKIYIVAEVRESHSSYISSTKIYNDYVSKKSVMDLVEGIVSNGYMCEYLGGIKELYDLYNKRNYSHDDIFINYNYGLPAQYKRVQCPAILELMNVKYSGSDPFVSLLVNDKAYCKKILSNINILSPKGFMLYSTYYYDKIFEDNNLSLPLVIKPNAEGSSLGIDEKSFCTSYKAAQKKTCEILDKFKQLIVEEYIEGYECTVWIIGNKTNFKFIKPLIVSCNNKYYFKDKIFTLNDKANHSRAYDLPENILSPQIVCELEIASKKIFSELGLQDYARIDFRIRDQKIYFIEANALPIFSRTSEIGAITKLYNITYNEICNILTEVILERLVSKTN